MDSKKYEDRAIAYCEEYGIFPHQIKEKKLIYYANYPKTLAESRRTYKVVVNLEEMTERRVLLKRWSSKGIHNYLK